MTVKISHRRWLRGSKIYYLHNKRSLKGAWIDTLFSTNWSLLSLATHTTLSILTATERRSSSLKSYSQTRSGLGFRFRRDDSRSSRVRSMKNYSICSQKWERERWEIWSECNFRHRSLLNCCIKYRFFTVATTDSTEAGFGFFYTVFYFLIPFRMNWISSCCPTPWAGCRVRSMQKRVNHCNFLCVDYRCTQQQSRVRLELVDFFVFCECVQWICSFSRSKREKKVVCSRTRFWTCISSARIIAMDGGNWNWMQLNGRVVYNTKNAADITRHVGKKSRSNIFINYFIILDLFNHTQKRCKHQSDEQLYEPQLACE